MSVIDLPPAPFPASPPAIDPVAARGRLERAQAALATDGVDVVIAHHSLTLRHLAALVPERWPAVLLLAPGDALLVHFVPGLFADDQLVPSRQEELTAFAADRVVALETQLARTLEPELRRALREGATIGLEADTAPGWIWSLLRDFGALDRVADVGPRLRALRRAKDPDEIEIIAYNAALAERAYARATELVRPGTSEVELYVAMLGTVQELAGGPVPHVGDFAAGPGGGLRGGWPTRRALVDGDSYVIDWQTGAGGYWSDLSRTFPVGTPSRRWRDAHAAVEAALDAAACALAAGVPVGVIDQTARAALAAADAAFGGGVYPHITGHGTGAISHEAPYLVVGDPDVLVAGDVVTVEPGLYGEVLRGGIRIEDNYLVLEGGARRLSSFPRDGFDGSGA